MDPRNWNRSLRWQGTVEALCSMQSKRGINNNKYGRIILKWILVTEWDSMDCIHLIQNRDKW
jgi:hypothetical protein